MRNVRTYEHFCLVARALERVGDRWSLLVIRDLLTGPKRFTDLADRLGGITPKTLTQRLRELQDADLVSVDRRPGRREVWYRLTTAGSELQPVVEALGWWSLRNAWRPPAPGEVLHSEHLLQAVVLALNRAGADRKPAVWHIDIPADGRYRIVSDGARWSLIYLTAPEPAQQDGDVDVTVTATREQLLGFVANPSLDAADSLGIEIAGRPASRRRFVRLLRTLLETADA